MLPSIVFYTPRTYTQAALNLIVFRARQRGSWSHVAGLHFSGNAEGVLSNDFQGVETA